MDTAVFSTKPFERTTLTQAVGTRHALRFLDATLSADSAPLAAGCRAVCAFVNDRLDAPCLEALWKAGVRFVALRSAGFNHIDLTAADRLGFRIARVPAYSPHAVAEHTVALLLTVNRKTHRAYNRVREQNFSLDGLQGFDLFGKTVGVIGTGKIGACFARIMRGFGCRVLASDPAASDTVLAMGVEYVALDELLAASDVVSLHCPLTPSTKHIINERTLGLLKPGVVLLNTGRGALVDTPALIAALKRGRLGAVGLDVYEEEADLFFRDLSATIIQDDVFMRLLTFPNVLITAHQGFFTREALQGIADVTAKNLDAFEAGTVPPGQLSTAKV
jgi:D-lactate dehydrogenase